jgi:hypothetical protein
MMLRQRYLPRRTVLRGLGAAVGLPLLDAMVPALAPPAVRAMTSVQRLGIVYVPNGVNMADWTPKRGTLSADPPRTLRPLAPFADRVVVLSNLSTSAVKNPNGVHAGPATRFLTSVNPKRTFGSNVEAGVSIDQIVARQWRDQTPLGSLEVGLESFESAGSCDVGLSCAYTSTICWRTPTAPLPMEHNPRAVFERLFGDGGTTDAAGRAARIQNDRSILDSVTAKAKRLERELGARDRVRLADYLEAVRDLERRIQHAEASARAQPTVEQPVGIPGSFEQHAKLMFDLQLLAYQSDLTRVITFMVAREFSGRTYPEVGAPDAHHPTSHHEGLPDKLEKLTRINTFHVSLFAYYLDRLQQTPDGDGSLLDHLLLLYGSGIGDGNDHDTRELPILLAGGKGVLAGGRHLQYGPQTPLANLHLAMLNTLGIPLDAVGNSTAPLEGLRG